MLDFLQTFPAPGVAFYYFGLKRNDGGRYGICADCNPNQNNFDTVDGLNETDTDESNPPVRLLFPTFLCTSSHDECIFPW